MENKSALWIVTILLAVACLYELSFTWVAKNFEGKALEYAKDKVDSVKAVNPDMDLYAEETALRNFESEYLTKNGHKEAYPLLGFTYKEVKKHEINLGLDLQGGMNVTLEVSVVDVIKALSGYSADPAFVQAIENAKKMQRDSQEDFVTLFGKAFEEAAPGQKLAAIFHTRENKDKFPREATNEEVLKIIAEEAESAISRTEQVIRKRIDNLGVVQPKVQRLEASGRILVELPGVKEKERVRKILQGTAKLEFWETYDNRELYTQMNSLNDELKKVSKGDKDSSATDSTAVASDSTATANADTTKAKSDDLMSQLEGDKKDSAGAAASADSAKADGAQTFDQFAKENPLFGVLRPMLTQDAQGNYFPGQGPSVGYAHVKDTAKVKELLFGNAARRILPAKIKFLWDAKPYDDKGVYYQLFAIKVSSRDGRAPMEGDVVTDARRDNDPLGNPEVTMLMNGEGAKTWKLLTKENIGKSIAIVLDNYVYSAPTVQSEIAGGRSSISGRFTVEEAEDLGNVLKAGKLPAPANIIEEAIVGPSLGKEAIKSGFTSFAIALLLVLVYMFIYYSRAGAVADIALFANLFFILGVLASLGATLTLPGIAGIVLTIGMSVDANVLIFERIREEMRMGKGMKLAIVDGYKNAYSSIFDSNLTTGITAVILLIFGTGPIQGFATTLIIGILTSLFSAIVITRLIFEIQMNKGQEISFSTKFSENILKGAKIDFVGKRKLFYAISGIIIVIGLGSMFTRGFNLGIDFTGGRTYLVRFENSADIEKVGAILENVFVEEDGVKQRPEVKTFGSSNQVKITTKYLIYETGAEAEDKVEAKLNEGLTQIGDKFEVLSSQKVGATVADDIKVSAFWSVLFSLIIIFLYIVFRFKSWQFGAGALIALVHDVLMVLAVFSLFWGILPFSLEIDQAFIAAILTVVGYSINDTVVVFDRIREHLGLSKRKDHATVINEAVNDTLSRTINTSLTTLFVLLMIFIFGGEVIRGFVFAILIGIMVGTYSSICIATPVVVDFESKKKE